MPVCARMRHLLPREQGSRSTCNPHARTHAAGVPAAEVLAVLLVAGRTVETFPADFSKALQAGKVGRPLKGAAPMHRNATPPNVVGAKMRCWHWVHDLAS